MPKLTLKGGRTMTEREYRYEQEESSPSQPPTDSHPEQNQESQKDQKDQGSGIDPKQLRAAWEKLEGYHPLTEQALEEVLQSFLAGRTE